MTNIPEDVMKAAKAALDKAWAANGAELGGVSSGLWSGLTEAAARAIMAERQRCIRVLAMWALANEDADTSLLQGAIDEIRKGGA